MIKQELEEHLEVLEYELETAKDELRKAEEDGNNALIPRAKRMIRELERQILNAQYQLEELEND